MSHHIDPRSVDSYLSGICSSLEPYFPDVRRARSSALVARTLRGCKRLHSKPIRGALLADDLYLAVASLPSRPAHDDLLFISQLLTGFHVLLRFGELTWPDQRALQSFRKLTLRTSLSLLPDSFEFLLPTNKADPFFEGNRVVVHASVTTPDPLVHFTRYLASRDRAFPVRAELWLRADGTVPTRSWFMRKLRSLFPRDVAGHSMRAGGTTSLAAAGVPPSAIQAINRWSSSAWQCYVRKHPALLHAMLFNGRSLHDGPLPLYFFPCVRTFFFHFPSSVSPLSISP
ncbi:hypothetical protein LXA43DRAFT_1099487 [Ganoderma leucocontextum]|nr:hypothetical protein LXA43DRAFT_1099487 [Ganoderma leucocontextum]